MIRPPHHDQDRPVVTRQCTKQVSVWLVGVIEEELNERWCTWWDWTGEIRKIKVVQWHKVRWNSPNRSTDTHEEQRGPMWAHTTPHIYFAEGGSEHRECTDSGGSGWWKPVLPTHLTSSRNQSIRIAQALKHVMQIIWGMGGQNWAVDQRKSTMVLIMFPSVHVLETLLLVSNWGRNCCCSQPFRQQRFILKS